MKKIERITTQIVQIPATPKHIALLDESGKRMWLPVEKFTVQELEEIAKMWKKDLFQKAGKKMALALDNAGVL